MNFLPDAIGYGVGARGGRARGFSEGGGDFFLTYRKVVRVGGEVDISRGRGQGGREEVVQEG